MKKIGAITLTIGALITVFTSLTFTYSNNEKLADAGNFQINERKSRSIPWSPFVGIAVLVIGGGAYMLGIKRSLAHLIV